MKIVAEEQLVHEAWGKTPWDGHWATRCGLSAGAQVRTTTDEEEVTCPACICLALRKPDPLLEKVFP